MSQSVALLENALRSWENIRLIEEYGVRRAIIQGTKEREELTPSLRHWRELRQHLLHVPHQGFDHARFFSDSPLFGHFPMQLASWIGSSRRVFHLTMDLMRRFIAADYSNYKWSDLLWPFDSFAISCEGMLGMRREDCSEYSDFVLISSMRTLCPDYPYGEENGFEINFFVRGTGPRRDFGGSMELGSDYRAAPDFFIPPKDHVWLDENLLKKRWSYLERNASKIADHFQNNCDLNGFPAGYSIPTSLHKEDPINTSSPLMKVIAGLCLYLEALPPGVSERTWRNPSIKAPRLVRKLITEETKVCDVMDIHTISPSTMTLFPETLKRGPAHTVTPHWRRAHYRRPAGSAPDAPRTIEVRQTLVHKDQLPDGALPGGVVSSVS